MTPDLRPLQVAGKVQVFSGMSTHAHTHRHTQLVLLLQIIVPTRAMRCRCVCVAQSWLAATVDTLQGTANTSIIAVNTQYSALNYTVRLRDGLLLYDRLC